MDIRGLAAVAGVGTDSQREAARRWKAKAEARIAVLRG
jgi:hypothetical protein